MTINVRTRGIDESCQKRPERGILEALGGCLLGVMVINTERFRQGCDSDVQQRQQKKGRVVNPSPDRAAVEERQTLLFA